MAALRQRVTLALRLAQANRNVLSPEGVREVAELARLLAAVGAEMPRVHEIGSKLNAFTLLARNGANHSELAAEMQSLVSGIQERLRPFAYPFPHARGRLTVAEYARSEKPAQNDSHRVYLDSDAHVDRLFALHYKLIGRILAEADAEETDVEKH